MEAVRYQPRYTIADYEQWEGDWELWDGVAVSMSPSSTYRHQRLAYMLLRVIGDQLEDAEGCHCEVVHEHDWRVSDTTVVRPDIMVICEKFEGEWVNIPPTLIVEVLSPATEHKDRTAKRDLYAQMGVRHYLLAELRDGSIEALSLHGQAYEPVGIDQDGHARLELHEGCTVRVPDRVTI